MKIRFWCISTGTATWHLDRMFYKKHMYLPTFWTLPWAMMPCTVKLNQNRGQSGVEKGLGFHFWAPVFQKTKCILHIKFLHSECKPVLYIYFLIICLTLVAELVKHRRLNRRLPLFCHQVVRSINFSSYKNAKTTVCQNQPVHVSWRHQNKMPHSSMYQVLWPPQTAAAVHALLSRGPLQYHLFSMHMRPPPYSMWKDPASVWMQNNYRSRLKRASLFPFPPRSPFTQYYSHFLFHAPPN